MYTREITNCLNILQDPIFTKQEFKKEEFYSLEIEELKYLGIFDLNWFKKEEL